MKLYQGPGPNNSLRHADNRKWILSISLTRNRREAHMFHLASEVEKVWRCSCWEKGKFVNSNRVKPKKSDHLHLVYHFTVSLSKHEESRKKWSRQGKWRIALNMNMNSIYSFIKFTYFILRMLKAFNIKYSKSYVGKIHSRNYLTNICPKRTY